MELAHFLLNYALNWDDVWDEMQEGSSVGFPFPITPLDFVGYAKADLHDTTDRGTVNALTNAKRAIDCQIDGILKVFGLGKRRNFPEKAKIILDLGFTAPNIISRLIKIRNYLEHQYVVPNRERVEDSVDVAVLFIESSSRIFRMFHNDMNVGQICHKKRTYKFNDYVNIAFDERELTCTLTGYLGGDVVCSLQASNHDINYIPFLRFLLSCDSYYSDHGGAKALQNLIIDLNFNKEEP